MMERSFNHALFLSIIIIIMKIKTIIVFLHFYFSVKYLTFICQKYVHGVLLSFKCGCYVYDKSITIIIIVKISYLRHIICIKSSIFSLMTVMSHSQFLGL